MLQVRRCQALYRCRECAHQPVNPWVFNVRATYQREAERAVRHLSLIGLERVALLRKAGSGAQVVTLSNNSAAGRASMARLASGAEPTAGLHCSEAVLAVNWLTTGRFKGKRHGYGYCFRSQDTFR